MGRQETTRTTDLSEDETISVTFVHAETPNTEPNGASVICENWYEFKIDSLMNGEVISGRLSIEGARELMKILESFRP